MNRSISIILFLIITQNSFSKEIIIKGQFDNAANSRISIMFSWDPITLDKENVELALNNLGSFELSYNITTPRWVNFIVDNNPNKQGYFTAFPGDTIFIRGDIEDLESTLTYHGNNRAYDRYAESIFKGGDWINNIDFEESNVNWDSIRIKLKKLTSNRLLELDRISESGILSDLTYDYAWSQIKYYEYYNLNFLLSKSGQLGNKELIQEIFIYDNPKESSALLSPAFSFYIDWHILYMYNISIDKLGERPTLDFDFLNGIYHMGRDSLKGTARDAYLTRQIYFGLKKGIAGIENLYEEYRNDCLSDELKRIAEDEYNLFRIVQDSKEELEYNILSSEEYTLQNLIEENKGKVLLLKFWGSWCIPCIKSIPSFNNIRSRFDRNQLEIIHIAYKDTKNNLEFALKKYGLVGVHIILDSNNEEDWREIVNFTSVPYYAIFDTHGNLVEHSVFDITSDENNIIERIDKILNKR